MNYDNIQKATITNIEKLSLEDKEKVMLDIELLHVAYIGTLDENVVRVDPALVKQAFDKNVGSVVYFV